MSDGSAPDPMIFMFDTAPETKSLRIFTSNTMAVGLYNFKVAVAYDAVPTIMVEVDFVVNIINNCDTGVTSTAPLTMILDQVYIVDDPPTIFTFDAFTPSPYYC